MKLFKKIFLFILVGFIGIQFIRPSYNTSEKVLSTDILSVITVPGNIENILKSACYDCHSNNTRYPWYMNVQPMGWMMAKHINEGKGNLNFSEFGMYTKRKQANKLRAIATSIKEGSMPIRSYTIMHPDSKLNDDDKKTVVAWATKTRDSLLKN